MSQAGIIMVSIAAQSLYHMSSDCVTTHLRRDVITNLLRLTSLAGPTMETTVADMPGGISLNTAPSSQSADVTMSSLSPMSLRIYPTRWGGAIMEIIAAKTTKPTPSVFVNMRLLSDVIIPNTHHSQDSG